MGEKKSQELKLIQGPDGNLYFQNQKDNAKLYSVDAILNRIGEISKTQKLDIAHEQEEPRLDSYTFDYNGENIKILIQPWGNYKEIMAKLNFYSEQGHKKRKDGSVVSRLSRRGKLTLLAAGFVLAGTIATPTVINAIENRLEEFRAWDEEKCKEGISYYLSERQKEYAGTSAIYGSGYNVGDITSLTGEVYNYLISLGDDIDLYVDGEYVTPSGEEKINDFMRLKYGTENPFEDTTNQEMNRQK